MAFVLARTSRISVFPDVANLPLRPPRMMAKAAASLDDRFSTWWPGLLIGAACAALAFAVTSAILARTRSRLDPQAAAALPLYAGGASLIVAGLSVLLPPLAVVAGGLIGWLRAAGRRREGQKYAGLRILR